ncbi:nitroreductase family protein [Paenibacillus sp. ACRRX]|uniref:nitroreductase family protein n=1 Tax=unclassified Paenibacillus TaxID=185978 RepID=UPI001EF4E86A|nr:MULTISPECIES: nitroreductase family protein [unclassified Paenibacillus]MCG7409082.1 nitroreductase family protein [Paenibacillus sp. ACRRX]MDK8181918.1 nitroreductase family protein [Paenibacillus sp. UMB4589-SE434]
MHTFETIVKDRRSANKFKTDVEINRQDFEDIFSLTKYAPSAFNLQHTRYIAVTDREKLDQIYEAANKQYKVKTASAAILVLGDTQAHKQAASIYEGMLHLGIWTKQEYDMNVESTTQFYEQRGEAFQREDAIRNASLSAMQLMLIAKDKGWDTCPMIGFDPELMRSILSVPDTHVPVMLITIGKEDTSSRRPRGYRKPVGEYVSYNAF